MNPRQTFSNNTASVDRRAASSRASRVHWGYQRSMARRNCIAQEADNQLGTDKHIPITLSNFTTVGKQSTNNSGSNSHSNNLNCCYQTILSNCLNNSHSYQPTREPLSSAPAYIKLSHLKPPSSQTSYVQTTYIHPSSYITPHPNKLHQAPIVSTTTNNHPTSHPSSSNTTN